MWFIVQPKPNLRESHFHIQTKPWSTNYREITSKQSFKSVIFMWGAWTWAKSECTTFVRWNSQSRIFLLTYWISPSNGKPDHTLKLLKNTSIQQIKLRHIPKQRYSKRAQQQAIPTGTMCRRSRTRLIISIEGNTELQKEPDKPKRHWLFWKPAQSFRSIYVHPQSRSFASQRDMDIVMPLIEDLIVMLIQFEKRWRRKAFLRV